MNLKETLKLEAINRTKQRFASIRMFATEKRKRDFDAIVRARNCAAGLYPTMGDYTGFNRSQS